MSYPKICTIQDISCVGQCSLTVALPILSACGVETCILPSAVLSTHTGGFTGYTCRDLTDDIPAIRDHWAREGIRFDCIYTGYLGSERQIEDVRSIIATLLRDGGLTVIDPAMADNGKLYPAFDQSYVEAMKKLLPAADILLPNITEACCLTDTPYPAHYDMDDITRLAKKLTDAGARAVVLTGVSDSPDTTGVAVFDGTHMDYYRHKKIAGGFHGTGDVYASAFTGALLNGKAMFDAAKIAADYTLCCIEKTVGDESHKYGVKFELALPSLIRQLGL